MFLYRNRKNREQFQDMEATNVTATDAAAATAKGTSKKVSFSDELPGADTATVNASNDNNTMTTTTTVSHCAPMEYVLRQNINYLNKLHESAVNGNNDTTTTGDDVVDESSATSDDVHSQRRRASILKPPSSSTAINQMVDDSSVDTVLPFDAIDRHPSSTMLVENYRDDIDQNNGNVFAAIDRTPPPPTTCVSFMELEVRREKRRWLLISECSVLLGDGRHTQDGFRKMFYNEVRLRFFLFLFLLLLLLGVIFDK